MSTVASPGATPPAARSFSTPRATSSRTRRATAVPSISRAVTGCSCRGRRVSGKVPQHALPPGLGRPEIVEGEDVEALDVVVRLRDVRGEPLDDLVGVVATQDEEPPEHA